MTPLTEGDQNDVPCFWSVGTLVFQSYQLALELHSTPWGQQGKGGWELTSNKINYIWENDLRAVFLGVCLCIFYPVGSGSAKVYGTVSIHTWTDAINSGQTFRL